MNNFNVKTGDSVKFNFSSGKQLSGKVLYIPASKGESWIIQTFFEGSEDLIVYVKNFESMFIYRKRDE